MNCLINCQGAVIGVCIEGSVVSADGYMLSYHAGSLLPHMYSASYSVHVHVVHMINLAHAGARF